MPDGPWNIWARLAERFADDPALIARIRARHDDRSILRALGTARDEYMLETGRAEMLQAAINTDVEREEAGEPALPKVDFRLPPDAAFTIMDRAIDIMRDEALAE